VKGFNYRAFLTFLLLFFGLATIITGITKLEEIEDVHAIYGPIFGALVMFHLYVNRRPLLNYFKRNHVELAAALVIFLLVTMVGSAVGEYEFENEFEEEYEFEYEED